MVPERGSLHVTVQSCSAWQSPVWVRKVGWGPGAAVEDRRTQLRKSGLPEARERIPAWPVEVPGMSFGVDARGLACRDACGALAARPGAASRLLSWRPQPVTEREGHKGPSASRNTQTTPRPTADGRQARWVQPCGARSDMRTDKVPSDPIDRKGPALQIRRNGDQGCLGTMISGWRRRVRRAASGPDTAHHAAPCLGVNKAVRINHLFSRVSYSVDNRGAAQGRGEVEAPSVGQPTGHVLGA